MWWCSLTGKPFLPRKGRIDDQLVALREWQPCVILPLPGNVSPDEGEAPRQESLANASIPGCARTKGGR
jgi:hypothetical protein